MIVLVANRGVIVLVVNSGGEQRLVAGGGCGCVMLQLVCAIAEHLRPVHPGRPLADGLRDL